MSVDRAAETLLRDLAPQVLAALVRRHGTFDSCEDAVQEALLAAATQWPVQGLPDNPLGWLITAASRRWVEIWRADTARRRREDAVHATHELAGAEASGVDDSLTLLFLCCHPALTDLSRVALTLRAVGGLTTTEIARALLVPDATVAQRISRAKQTIRASGARFDLPGPADRAERLAAVHRVLYLIFNEGYTATSGAALGRVELTGEAIRLTRQLLAGLPDDGETAGLLALMLLTDARRPARTRADGTIVPLPEQDRSRWDQPRIAEGTALLEDALRRTAVGPYQVQAAIAAVHDEARNPAATDWAQILGLYDLLLVLGPSPTVVLNRIVAVAMVRGPQVAMHALDKAVTDPALARHPRVGVVRAHLLEMAGDVAAARAQFRAAAKATRNAVERDYLESRAFAQPVRARITP